jgi:hypothetical protein
VYRLLIIVCLAFASACGSDSSGGNGSLLGDVSGAFNGEAFTPTYAIVRSNDSAFVGSYFILMATEPIDCADTINVSTPTPGIIAYMLLDSKEVGTFTDVPVGIRRITANSQASGGGPGTVEITSIENSRVVGSVSMSATSGDSLNGSFDVLDCE